MYDVSVVYTARVHFFRVVALDALVVLPTRSFGTRVSDEVVADVVLVPARAILVAVA